MRLIDSHTGGEPTRLIVAGGPELGGGSLARRQRRFSQEYDHLRTAVILEPRGSDAMVGALLCEPTDSSAVAGVIFFNNRGFLGMCGHGTIGLAVTLYHRGTVGLGKHKIETPVGMVEIDLLEPNRVRIENVPSFRHEDGVVLAVDGLGEVSGSIAWGGNWFFLIDESPVELTRDNIPQLTAAAASVQRALNRDGVTGANGAAIDHIEFFGPSQSPGVDSRNFVLCPGGAYDRSPCGTGTSAKLACLAASGKLSPGETWVQESIIGSRFEASYRVDADDNVIPAILGSAYVSAETELVMQPEDPFRYGIR